ncbi:GL26010 [Drosophila persimilis]|uniref:GL26010 n=1 Tax=Drosophila persimilis TaxID=7234 RepID=B4GK48_DROPE|nr:GL26010 [Drosophila persimilis]
MALHIAKVENIVSYGYVRGVYAHSHCNQTSVPSSDITKTVGETLSTVPIWPSAVTASPAKSFPNPWKRSACERPTSCRIQRYGDFFDLLVNAQAKALQLIESSVPGAQADKFASDRHGSGSGGMETVHPMEAALGGSWQAVTLAPIGLGPGANARPSPARASVKELDISS